MRQTERLIHNEASWSAKPVFYDMACHCASRNLWFLSTTMASYKVVWWMPDVKHCCSFVGSQVILKSSLSHDHFLPQGRNAKGYFDNALRVLHLEVALSNYELWPNYSHGKIVVTLSSQIMTTTYQRWKRKTRPDLHLLFTEDTPHHSFTEFKIQNQGKGLNIQFIIWDNCMDGVFLQKCKLHLSYLPDKKLQEFHFCLWCGICWAIQASLRRNIIYHQLHHSVLSGSWDGHLIVNKINGILHHKAILGWREQME